MCLWIPLAAAWMPEERAIEKQVQAQGHLDSRQEIRTNAKAMTESIKRRGECEWFAGGGESLQPPPALVSTAGREGRTVPCA